MRKILAKLLLELLAIEEEVKKEKNRNGFARIYRLTPRHIQITKLLLDGYSYPEIAKKLAIAVHTVRCHARRIYILLGVKGRWDVRSGLSAEEANLIRKLFEELPN
jgi:ATP/maltotriose-dependent transcriptional regulator MalT